MLHTQWKLLLLQKTINWPYRNGRPELPSATILGFVGAAILDDGSSQIGLGHMAQTALAW